MTKGAMDAVRSSIRTYGHRRLEIEWRLGLMQPNGFRPGITECEWMALKHALDESCAFTCEFKQTRECIAPDGKLVLPDNTWIFKKRLHTIDEKTQRAWTVRCSVCLEEQELNSQEPTRKFKFERHKRRWSYKYRCWSIDLTRVRSNLPEVLDNDCDTFEVEIELIDQDVLLVRPLDNVLEWGSKLVDDMCALMAQ